MPKLINLVLPVYSLTAMTIVPIFTKSPPSSRHKDHKCICIYVCGVRTIQVAVPSGMWQQEKHGVDICHGIAALHLHMQQSFRWSLKKNV